MIKTIQSLLHEMQTSGIYHAILWAGGYPGSVPHTYSDIDLYAVSRHALPRHRYMERHEGRRIELTVFTQDKWREILSTTGPHPKHHYSFIHGQVLHDPQTILPALRSLALDSLPDFKLSPEELESIRNNLAIQYDKLRGFREKAMPMQIRYHSIGVVHMICDLLCRFWDGYAVDGGKNLNRVLSHPLCPEGVRCRLQTLLTTADILQMADSAEALVMETFAITGGEVLCFNGGIPRHGGILPPND